MAPGQSSVHRRLDDRRIEKGQRQHHPYRAFGSLFSPCQSGHIGDRPGDKFVEPASGQSDSLEQPGLFIDADRSNAPVGRCGRDDVSPAGRGRLSPINDSDIRRTIIHRFVRAAYLDMIRADDDAIEPAGNDITVGELRLTPIPSPTAKFRENQLLDWPGWDSRDGARLVFPPLSDRTRYVVAITRALLDRMAWRHRVAAIIENLAHQQGAALGLAIGGAVQIVGELSLHRVEQPDIDNRLMLGRPGTAMMIEFAEIVAVLL